VDDGGYPGRGAAAREDGSRGRIGVDIQVEIGDSPLFSVSMEAHALYLYM